MLQLKSLTVFNKFDEIPVVHKTYGNNLCDVEFIRLIESLKLATLSADFNASKSWILFVTNIPLLHSCLEYEIRLFIKSEKIIGELTQFDLVPT